RVSHCLYSSWCSHAKMNTHWRNYRMASAELRAADAEPMGIAGIFGSGLLRRERRRFARLQIPIAGLREFCVENPGRHQRPQHLRRAAGDREHAGIANHAFERIVSRVAPGTEQLERLV